MNSVVFKTFAVATLLFISSLVVFVIGWFQRFDPADEGGALWDWSFVFVGWSLWEYAAVFLFVAAVGFTMAAIRLRNQ